MNISIFLNEPFLVILIFLHFSAFSEFSISSMCSFIIGARAGRGITKKQVRFLTTEDQGICIRVFRKD